jgi:HD-GYP domain-containing protein (c-di-GMP phosphodiesterase class II)
MQDDCQGMLVSLQNFLANQKYSEAHAYRLSICVTRIAQGVVLDEVSVEDICMAALFLI